MVQIQVLVLMWLHPRIRATLKMKSQIQSITIFFFAKEGNGCVLNSTRENIFAPVTINFQHGLGQKFRQPYETSITLSIFEESKLLNVGDLDVYPVAVKADASSGDMNGTNETPTSGSKTNTNSQITQAVFEKEKGEFRVKVVKKILCVNGMRYGAAGDIWYWNFSIE
ncbi:unnamed protein product [Trifolium pratense]|uniref:Uncharacterized protein n=1 Tax=Trifolium pratense TaxID=57577 RepID=A0ACB0LMN3_TRIPR|nr:unnamed protein product [Trifolium pratense]